MARRLSNGRPLARRRCAYECMASSSPTITAVPGVSALLLTPVLADDDDGDGDDDDDDDDGDDDGVEGP